jgi:serine/threonine protein kinase
MVQQVGRYIVKSQIGKGAMGVVYLAEDPLLGRQAAIKTVDLSVEDPAERDFLRNRLLRDARAAAGLTHPNIVSVYDVVEEGDAAYLVLEFVPGDTLAASLATTPIPDLGFTTYILSGMAAALDYTHARGVIHRDIKPANVMIDPSGAPKIMDFGIARIADSRTNTPTGMVMGTIDYMSPEQIKGEPLDGRSDQFALGALAVRMLTGQTLYGQHAMATLTYKIVHEPVPAMCTRNAALPGAVDTVLARALAKTPGERYATCAQFVQDLATALSLTVSAPPTRIPFAAAAMIPVPQPPARPTAVPAAQPFYAASPAPGVPQSAPPSAPPPSAPQPVYPSVPQPVYESPMQAAPPRPAKRRSASIGAVAALFVCGGAVAVWQPWKQSAPIDTKAATVTAAVDSPQPSTPTEAASAVKTAPQSAAVKSVPTNEVPPRSDEAPKKPAPSNPPAATPPATEIDFTPPPDTTATEEEAPPTGTPQPAQDAYNLGHKLSQQRRFPEAVDSFNKALSIRPKWPMARFVRGRAYQQMNNCPAAIEDFNAVVQAKERYAAAYAYRGLCESHLKNDNAAFDDFEKTLAINGEFPMALFGRGVVYNHRGAYKKALADLNAAIALLPAYPNAFQARAVARRNLGDRAGASADDAKAQDLISAGRGQSLPH